MIKTTEIRPKIYRINAATTKLSVSRSTIYRLVKSGKLTLVKIGERASGITADSIDALITHVPSK
jgi:excisionase family DNA binding protein